MIMSPSCRIYFSDVLHMFIREVTSNLNTLEINLYEKEFFDRKIKILEVG